mgnify:CR=1 FL=1
MKYDKRNDLKNDRIVKFVTVKLWLRLLAVIIGSIILYLNFKTIAEGQYSIVAIIFGLIFLIAGLIENSWYFNITKEEFQRAINKINK